MSLLLTLNIMSNFQELVKEFQVTSGQKVSDVPYTMTQEEKEFRASLLKEEIEELRKALNDNDRVEILDALCDIKYVNDGTANMIGVMQNDDFHEIYYDTIGDIDAAIEVISVLEESDVLSINEHVYFIASMLDYPLDVFKEALTRVHISNMSKFCYDIKEAIDTVSYYGKSRVQAYYKEIGKFHVVFRLSDDKVLKSIEHWPVSLHDLVFGK